ncbi:hypothetical protein BU17DRAFT_69415 [Hysterangium stoloniferum]|nr:hypothetical protein BU17DRAFT_69415 [Hysterangium stoloniferum]
MHFSLLALLVSAATLVQSAPSVDGAASKFHRVAKRQYSNYTLKARNHVIHLANTGFNPVTIQIFKGEEVICNGSSAAAFTQRVLVMPSFGGESAVFLGSGENVPLSVSPSDPNDEFTIPAQDADYDLLVVFQFKDNSGSGFQNAVVNKQPTITDSDSAGDDIETTSEDSPDNDDNDTIFQVSTFLH